MVRQFQLIILISLSVLATGCCCIPGPACSPCSPYGGGCPLPLPLPLPIPVPTVVPLPLPLPIPVLSGAHVACALNTPLHPPICGGMDCCTDSCCSAPGGVCALGPAPCPPAQLCGDSCGEGHYGYGPIAPAQPIYPDAYGPTYPPNGFSPEAATPAPAPAPVPVPQNNLPETSSDASAFDATGIRRTSWEFSQAEVHSPVVLPGQRVSNRELRAQHVIGSPDAVSVLNVPAQ